MRYKVTIKNLNVLDKYIAWARRSKQAMEKIAVLVQRSIDLNFRESGRPEKWPQLHPITLALRRKLGRGAKPLIDTGQLRLQMVQHVTNTSVEHIAIAPYAHVHQQEGKWGDFLKVTRKGIKPMVLRGHGGGRKKSSREEEKFFATSVMIPARPFMLLQERDLEAIKTIILQHFTRSSDVIITET